jgi:hypothetical protein
MNILDAIIHAKNGAAVQQLGTQFGLGPDQTTAALSALVPALAAGFQRNMQSQDGIGNLVAAISNGNHERYINNPQDLGDQQAVAEGNGILGHVLGGKDVSRQVASRAAAQTGLSPDLLKQMLPLAANLMMGAFSPRTTPGVGAVRPGLSGHGGGIMEMLTPLLDKNRDGSIIDDVTAMIGRFVRPS